MPREETLDFVLLATVLRMTQPDLARLIESTPSFPKPISSERRGIWRRSDIKAWAERVRARQQMNQPNKPSGPRAA